MIVTEPTGTKGVTLLSKVVRMRKKLSVFSGFPSLIIGMLSQNCSSTCDGSIVKKNCCSVKSGSIPVPVGKSGFIKPFLA